jgi:hypothetical protein
LNRCFGGARGRAVRFEPTITPARHHDELLHRCAQARGSFVSGSDSGAVETLASARADAHAGAQPLWPYVSQFALGPLHLEHLPQWQRVGAAGLRLTLHPDLACTQVRDGTRELTLIGHMLDPHAPAAGNAELLRTLLAGYDSREALLAATAHLGGRWLLIATRDDDAFVFHDALGLRQAYYTDPARLGVLWVASQPGLLNDVLALEPDPQALDYLETDNFRRVDEYRWPGSASTFLGLRHLLPNHWLDLRTGEARRYWPAGPLPRLDPDSALARLGLLLSGQVQAAARRFDLALSLTAGFDSRVVLAAARPLAGRVRIVSVRQGRQPDRHPDVLVPARLLRRLDLPHDVVRAAPSMSPAFAFEFKRNVHWAHDHYGHDAEAILRRFGRRHAAITGSGAEVGRRPFRAKLPHADLVRLTPQALAWLEYHSQHPFLVGHFAEWLDGAGGQRHVKLLDLFEWEQDYGNWLAMVQLEFDVAWREIFTPYNCREVLATLLGVPERLRRARDALLWRRFIERAWPELLAEPFNPHNPGPGRLGQAWADAKAIRQYWGFERARRRCAHAGAG